jgi:hypothetical protein
VTLQEQSKPQKIWIWIFSVLWQFDIVSTLFVLMFFPNNSLENNPIVVFLLERSTLEFLLVKNLGLVVILGFYYFYRERVLIAFKIGSVIMGVVLGLNLFFLGLGLVAYGW